MATLVAGWFLLLPEDFKFVAKSVVAQAVLLANVFFMRNAGYFAENSDAEPLLHTWSLAVEEQFYLLFPLLLAFLARHHRPWLYRTILFLAAGSFGLSVACTHILPTPTFYLLPTRAWELLLGALLAIQSGKLPASGLAGETAGWTGLGLIGYAVFFFNQDLPFPGWAALAPCLGAALIIFSSAHQPSRVGRLLGTPPLVFIGLISYSLYLWHWPLLVFAKYSLIWEPQSPALRGGLLAASVVLAIITWKCVETPFRQRRLLPKRPQLFCFAGLSLATLLVGGFGVVLLKGLPGRCPKKIQFYLDSRNHVAFHNNVTLAQAEAGQLVEFGSPDTNQPVSVLVWGDSHAMAITPVLDDLCRQHHRRGAEATHSATAPLLGYVSPNQYSLRESSPAFAQAVLAFSTSHHVQIVIIAAYWANFPTDDAFKAKLVSTVRTLMASGARVYVLKDVPVPGFDVPRMTAFTVMQKGDLDQLRITREQYQSANHALDETFEKITSLGATVLDPTGYFLNQKGIYGVVRNGQVLYHDADHLTVEGSKILAPLFQPIFGPQ